MKLHEREIRDGIAHGLPLTLVTQSGERVKIRSRDHVFLPPSEDENGQRLDDADRSDFFEVWSDGRSKRYLAFNSINIIEMKEPQL